MTGRARGPGTRARPRVLAPGERDERVTEEEAMAGQSSSSSESGVQGNGEAIRGRGGLRSNQLITKPPGTKTTIGVGGAEINILANYFRIKIPDTDCVYDYHVDFVPNVEALHIRRGLISSLAEHFGNAYIFDGMSDLKSCVDLESPITYCVERQSAGVGTGIYHEVTLRQVGEIGFGSYEMLRLYNTQMRRNLSHIGLKLIGRYYYEAQPTQRINEHGGVAIYRGFLTAVNQHDGGLLTVTDTIFKFIRRETVRDFLEVLRDSQSTRWREDAKKTLVGQIVMTKFNNKTYRVSDIDYRQTPQDHFPRKDGTTITFIEYYKHAHEIEIRDGRQPMLIATATEKDRRSNELPPPVLLVPELCFMTGLTDKMRADYNFMKTVAASSKIGPPGRVAQLRQFLHTVKSNPIIHAEMGRWNMEMDDDLISLKGRVMSNEVLIMGDQSTTEIIRGDFSRNMRDKALFKTVEFTRWALVFPSRDEGIATEFKNTLIRVGAPMGINFIAPRPFKIENDRSQSYCAAIRNIPAEAQLIVCLVPNINKDRYDAIKKLLCIEYPIPSQVVTSRALSKKGGMMSICTKIAVQVACKVGAIPWCLEIPPKKIMVIGFDTYHDSSVRGRSAGGFVCTMNDSLTKYYSKVHFHDNREEMSNSLALSTCRAVAAYIELNGGPPDRVIFYRDGVGEGMIPYVYEKEVDLCKRGIVRGNGGKPIALTFIVVSKRVNARFFAERNDTYLNPPPGTIIDKVVTRRERYDFYLISQAVTEGTVSPTMFDILCDQSGWLPTNHQKLAYKLTHLYYNWAGTVKVPAPCQYAHKLAFLCGQSLHREPSQKLEKLLFFL